MRESMIAVIRKHKMFAFGDGVVVGLSGGADSVALLHILISVCTEMEIRVFAAHVNHNLRGASAISDENFVIRLCSNLGISLRVCQADVRGLAEAEGIGIEDAGRKLRYEYLRTAKAEFGAQKIAMGHNQDDSAETVIMNLCRGAGLKGLCGIAPVQGDVVRPLIEAPRHEIEDYLSCHSIGYINDETNFSNEYTRNRVRHIVLPMIIAHVNPNATEVIAKSAMLCAADEDGLAAAAHDAFSKCIEMDTSEKMVLNSPEISLNILQLSALPPAICMRVIREALRRLRGTTQLADIYACHMQNVLDIACGRTGRETHLPGVRVLRDYGRLRFIRAERATGCMHDKGWAYPLALDEPVFIPEINKTVSFTCSAPKSADSLCTKAFNYDNVMGTLAMRTRLPGDRIRLEGVGTKKLKDYFIDEKTPREVRDSIPLLADGNDILWILDEYNRENVRYKPDHGALCWVELH